MDFKITRLRMLGIILDELKMLQDDLLRDEDGNVPDLTINDADRILKTLEQFQMRRAVPTKNGYKVGWDE